MNAFTPISMPPVSCLNLGSGKDFRADSFNLDVDDSWHPDAVLDLSAVDLSGGGVALDTLRFGRVTLGPGCFDRIVANDVLEHVPDLMRLMTACLTLLRLDGRFEISVPYDLSYGAWQDPTHVRAFNERSWLYYTDWFWYMGWDRARFALEHLQFMPSPLGEALQRQGAAREAILTTPRAIDSMSVVLRKVELNADDHATWAHWRERRRTSGASSGLLAGTGSAATAVQLASPEPAPASPASAVPASEPDAASARSEGPPAPFGGSWAEHADRHCIWIVSPAGYSHHRAFDDIAAGLSAAFAERGGSAPVIDHPSAWAGRTPIVLGAHLLGANLALALPHDSILFNLEQVDPSSGWLNADYLALLGRHRVLDYSHANLAALRALGVTHARLLPLGFAEVLHRIAPAPLRDIDVLFYGSLNDRRAAVLKALAAQGVAVVHLFDVYGAERDAAIARAKVVLNLHYYEAAVFESARVGYLLANGACVVTEGRDDDPDITPLRGGLAVCGYDELVPLCSALLRDEALRDELAARGRAIARAHRQADLLAAHFAADGGG